MQSESIIFFGTPDFAVSSLEMLIDQKMNVKLVVTQPDRPKGRGLHLEAPPIKRLAQKHRLSLLQVPSFKNNSSALNTILNVPCDFLVTVAFGQILPESILQHPRVAPLNVHASLLPAYRGAAPIARAIMEGEKITGVTIQWMTQELDMGDILYQLPCSIQEEDTAHTLHEKLKGLGAQALKECLELFLKNQIQRKKQEKRIGSYAEKLKKEEARISFHQPAQVVHQEIMGMNPWPIAECQLAGQRLRIFKSKFIPRSSWNVEPGTVIEASEEGLIVACQEGSIALIEIQLESRKRMLAREFVKGHPIPQGLILGDCQ